VQGLFQQRISLILRFCAAGFQTLADRLCFPQHCRLMVAGIFSLAEKKRGRDLKLVDRPLVGVPGLGNLEHLFRGTSPDLREQIK